MCLLTSPVPIHTPPAHSQEPALPTQGPLQQRPPLAPPPTDTGWESHAQVVAGQAGSIPPAIAVGPWFSQTWPGCLRAPGAPGHLPHRLVPAAPAPVGRPGLPPPPPALGADLAQHLLLLVSVLQGELSGDPRAPRPQGLPRTEGKPPPSAPHVGPGAPSTLDPGDLKVLCSSFQLKMAFFEESGNTFLVKICRGNVLVIR